MIQRYWKVYCDYCGDLLAEFAHKPTREELEQQNLFCTATKVFCSAQCHDNATVTGTTICKKQDT